MNYRNKTVRNGIMTAALLSTLAFAPATVAPYHFIREIIVGGEGGWDYLTVDAGARRLYVTHTSRVIVIDLDKNQVTGEIADTPGVHGFALAPELGLGFSSNGAENKASIVDLKTLKTLSKVDTGEDPDAILYVPQKKEVYTFNGRGQSATVFEAGTGKVVTTVPLPGKPEFAVLDRAAGRIYDNIENQDEVVVLDVNTHSIVATWPIAPAEEPTGMAIDTQRHRLFIAARNKRMVMMDSTTGKILAGVPIGAGVDSCAYDPTSGLAFSSCADGTVTLAQEKGPGKLTVVQTLTTAKGARTMALDPKTHRIYLCAAGYAPLPGAAPGTGRPLPPMIRGSLKVLVYGVQ